MVESMESWGVALILQIQAFAMPALNGPMRLLSGLGEESLYLLVIPFLYWCVHRKVGLRLLYFLLLSVLFNTSFKWIWHLPRPYWIASEVRAMYVETGFGAPSGHSQNALGVWMYLAWLLHRHTGKKQFYLPAGLLALLISFSRLYLGVHFPHDVLAGWLFASGLLLLFMFLPDRISHWTEQGALPFRTVGASVALLLLLGGSVWWIRQNFMVHIPASWQELALAAHRAMGKEVPIAPYSIKTVVSALALLGGVGLALPFSARRLAFQTTGSWSRRLLRYFLGIMLFFVLYIGLSVIFPKSDEAFYLYFRALRYFLLAIWVVALAPGLFLKLGLAEPQRHI